MKARVIAASAALVLLALATPYSLVGLGELSPVGEAQAHVCDSPTPVVDRYVCCPFNAHHHLSELEAYIESCNLV